MDYHYTLTATGYAIYKDGVLYVDQPFNPELPGKAPYTPADAEAAAQALIAALTAPAEPEQVAE